MSGAEVIFIRATAKRNGLTSLLIGAACFLLSLVLFAVLPDSMFLLGVFALTTSIVAMLIGWFKIREPAHSFEISKKAICYYNRRGHWQLEWNNIQRIDVPRATRGIVLKDMELVGIKIREYGPLLKSISPRLITNLLTEQRALLLNSDKCASGTCYSEAMFEDDRYKLEDGTEIKGIPAMMANRMRRLRELFGYDLFISASELDRDKEEFVQLLRQCQSQIVLNR